MSGIFDRFKKLLREGAPSAGRLAEEHVAANDMIIETKAEIDRLGKLRSTLLDADDAAQDKNRRAITAARDKLEDLALYVAEFEKRHAVAAAAEDQQNRVEAFKTATKQADAAAKLLEREYPAACKRLIDIMRIVAEAQRAVQQVNRRPPEDGGFIVDPEQRVREVSGILPLPLSATLTLPGLKGPDAPFFQIQSFYDSHGGSSSIDPEHVIASIDAAFAAERI